MGKKTMQEQILRASKEIAVKFIEAGRLSPGGFPETFKTIYEAIDATVHTTQSLQSGDASDTAESAEAGKGS